MISIDYIVYGGVRGMIDMLDKGHIIKLIEKGMSFRQVSKKTGLDRKTVTRYYKEHEKLMEKISESDCPSEIRDIQNDITSKPAYKKREKRLIKWTEDMDEFLDHQLELEKDRDNKFGVNHKQKITNVMVHELMLKQGFEIGLSSVQSRMKEKRKKLNEVFVRQTYKPGQRFEFDYGEIWLMIKEIKTKLHLAVISSPYSDYRTAYLYSSQNQKTFMDAHLRLFNEIGGVPYEIVYDNMRNVVSKFIGKNEKLLNQELVQLSLYYGFNINVTNCFSGNEKGHVEGSVRYIRNKVFTTDYEFESIEEAEQHLALRVIELNKTSKIEEEKAYLKPFRVDLDLAEVTRTTVNKYSTVRIENNFYSVPESLVGKKVTIKNYLKDIEVYYNHKRVCEHNKKDGHLEYIIDIMHYLRTFISKPGALKNSTALINNPNLKAIFDKYYSTQPKLFITLLMENKEKNKEELNEILLTNYNYKIKSKGIEENIIAAANTQISIYTNLLKGSTLNGKH
jgi:transposase